MRSLSRYRHVFFAARLFMPLHFCDARMQKWLHSACAQTPLNACTMPSQAWRRYGPSYAQQAATLPPIQSHLAPDVSSLPAAGITSDLKAAKLSLVRLDMSQIPKLHQTLERQRRQPIGNVPQHLIHDCALAGGSTALGRGGWRQLQCNRDEKPVSADRRPSTQGMIRHGVGIS